MKFLTSLRGMSRAALLDLIEASLGYAARMERRERAGKELAGKSIALMFFEPSTRTRLSFELAAHRLGGDVMNFTAATSSAAKGESLRDTTQTLAAMGADILVVRHSEAGVPDAVHDWIGLPVVSAGDGAREHPTQALLDAVTLTRHFGDLHGLRMGIIGDIGHSRVAGSLFHAMPTLGVDLTLLGPDSLLPDQPEHDLTTSSDLDGHLAELDIVYLLRVQEERGTVVDDDYHRQYGINTDRVATMKPDAVIMHPGPINRGVEITGEVADGPRSLILDQVSNGVPTRMAVLAALREGLA